MVPASPLVCQDWDPRVGHSHARLDPREPSPCGTQIEARVGMAHAWIPILADEGGRGYRSRPSHLRRKQTLVAL